MTLSCLRFKNMSSQWKKLKCWNWKLCLRWWIYCIVRVWLQIFKKWAKLYLNIFLRKSLNFRTKIENFWTLKILEMSWLAAWFIFKLVGVGAAPDLCEPQVFKMFLCKWWAVRLSLLVIYFTKNCTTPKFLTFNMNGQSGSATLLPFPASASLGATRGRAKRVSALLLAKSLQTFNLKIYVFKPKRRLKGPGNLIATNYSNNVQNVVQMSLKWLFFAEKLQKSPITRNVLEINQIALYLHTA